MEFSVVITTKDRARYLERALASLQAQLGAPRFEIIVVDNGSSDDTPGVVERFAVPERADESPAVRYVAAQQPNRGKARNRGVETACGTYLLFCDDDVVLPRGWIAAHRAAQTGSVDRVVNGPILNVPSYEDRPQPTAKNYSRAFLCTCNASLSKGAFIAAGGFDERFDLYGWEDTELGVRLRLAGIRWRFAWDAYLWHIKPPEENTIEVESRKAGEKARMAARFLAIHPSKRARLATGAHPINLWRARHFLPDWLLALYAGIDTSNRAPAWLRRIARDQFLDAVYARELIRSLETPDGP
jgi:GT2 family glycosyltransferase